MPWNQKASLSRTSGSGLSKRDRCDYCCSWCWTSLEKLFRFSRDKSWGNEEDPVLLQRTGGSRLSQTVLLWSSERCEFPPGRAHKKRGLLLAGKTYKYGNRSSTATIGLQETGLKSHVETYPFWRRLLSRKLDSERIYQYMNMPKNAYL